MKCAETVTFGGASFDRAAHLRNDSSALSEMLGDQNTKTLPVWRGKPLLNFENGVELGFVRSGLSILDEAHETAVFLGMDGEHPLFAMDISNWSAPDQDNTSVGAFIDETEQTHPSLPRNLRFAELRRNMAMLDARGAELAAMAVGVFAWHRAHGFCSKCGSPTQMHSGGWQRKCFDCGGLHFPRTDPVVIMLITRGNEVLIGRSPGWPEGMYSLLAGFMEPGETIEAAVRREIFEEAAVSVGRVGYLASQPWPFPSSLMIGCWGEATSKKITIDPHEIEDATWTSREAILDAWATKSKTLVSARKGSIAHFLIKNWLSDTLS